MSGPLPLLGLRAFTEVGRTGSMKAASRRLGVTQGAVSQQVKALEARLGVVLFERRNRALRLTEAGQRLLSEVSDAFDRIETALETLTPNRASHRTELTVSTTATFAATWLVPRLGRFTALHPGIEVQVLASQELVPLDGSPGGADIAIRHGLGEWPGVNAEPLLQPRLVPVGSPDLLAGGPAIRRPEDCLHYPLLHDSLPADWRLWLEALGADYRDARVARGSRFSGTALLIRAAIAGQGLALLRDIYVEEEVAVGRLMVALNVRWPARFAYYVVTPRSAPRRLPQVAGFRQWLFQEAAEA